jgi:hypothetical protein
MAYNSYGNGLPAGGDIRGAASQADPFRPGIPGGLETSLIKKIPAYPISA